LEYTDEAAAWLGERLGAAPEAVAESQRTQLYLPQGARPLRNPSGTACGFALDFDGLKVLALPGVPSEFRALFDLHCRPLLARRGAALLRRRVFTFGLPESRQRERLGDFQAPAPFRYSSLPSETGSVAIALEGFVASDQIASQEKILEAAWTDLLSRLPAENVVDKAGLDLPEAVFALLRSRGATVSVAESCTAGALGYLLTETPGSSEVFRQGYLTYSNAAKTSLLGVDAETLKAHGAVSEPTALAMARGCLQASGANFGVAVTGIAGPDGGNAEKPVGLVYVAVASARRAEAYRFQFRGNRKNVRWRSAYTALNCLRLFIDKELR
jgi:nicotinamide-nucleotide amidase